MIQRRCRSRGLAHAVAARGGSTLAAGGAIVPVVCAGDPAPSGWRAIQYSTSRRIAVQRIQRSSFE
jgi:hypothetical protein